MHAQRCIRLIVEADNIITKVGQNISDDQSRIVAAFTDCSTVIADCVSNASHHRFLHLAAPSICGILASNALANETRPGRD